MGYKECYSNSFQSELLTKARTNSMQLAKWYARGIKGNGDASCPLCQHQKEDVIHFLIGCKKLDGFRNKDLMKLLPKKSNREKTKSLLYKIKKWREVAEMILNMWNARKRMMELRNNNQMNT